MRGLSSISPGFTPNTLKVVSSNPAQFEVYSKELDALKFVSDLRWVFFSEYSGFIHNKTHRHDITEVLLKVALNTITRTLVSKHLPLNSSGFMGRHIVV